MVQLKMQRCLSARVCEDKKSDGTKAEEKQAANKRREEEKQKRKRIVRRRLGRRANEQRGG